MTMEKPMGERRAESCGGGGGGGGSGIVPVICGEETTGVTVGDGHAYDRPATFGLVEEERA